jgi:hypothetical protein
MWSSRPGDVFYALQVDGTTTLTAAATDSALVNGVVGLYANGVGWFDNYIATSDCDGGFQCLCTRRVHTSLGTPPDHAICPNLLPSDCLRMRHTHCCVALVSLPAALPGTVCSYTCGAGYILNSGTLVRTCTDAGSWTGTQLVCTITPPTILNQTISVFENATANSLVGSPVVAVQGSPTVAVTFAVVGGNDTTGLFQINFCSGQVSVVTTGLNARLKPVFHLLVRASSNGDVSSSANATITVLVLAVPHAPVFNDTAGPRHVSESAGMGTLLSPNITAYDQDLDAFTFSIVVTASFNYLVNVTSNGNVKANRFYLWNHAVASITSALTLHMLSQGRSSSRVHLTTRRSTRYGLVRVPATMYSSTRN